MHGDKETLRVCIQKASNPKSRREIHNRKPSGNRLFFNFQERDEEVDSGGDLVVVGCMGTKKHDVCVCSKGIKSEKPSGNSPSSKAVGEQAVFFNFQERDEEGYWW